jgi:mono/diheme cytochrome c family protein/cytochrome c553
MSTSMKQALIILLALTPITGYAAESFEYLGFDEDKMSTESRDGLREIYSGRMFNMASPLSLAKAMSAADAEKKDELGYDPNSVEGKLFSVGTLPSPPSRDIDADISLGEVLFERDGATLMGGNCFGCHAGVVNGKVVAGLGNNNVMQRPPKPEGTKPPNMFKLAAAVKTPADKKAMAAMMNYGKGSRSPLPETTNRGDNYGPFAVWAHGAQLEDPANLGLQVSYAKTELTELIENTMVPPVDPMPWWLMKYKVRDYWYGDANPSDAAHFSFNFTDSQDSANEIHESHVASTAKALAFARETQSPIFPDTLDAALVKQGSDIFHGRVEPADTAAFKACFECHGTYSKRSSHSDFSQPGGWNVDYKGSEELKKVRTDKKYNEVVQALRPVSEHINKIKDFYIAQEKPELAPHFEHLEGKGYIAPPLVGVWATAPYFHNGSVPTVEAVLNSKLRPEIWKRSQSAYSYDLESVGMEFTPMSRVEFDASAEKAAKATYKSKDSLEQMFIYDTEGFGRGNMGHTFGDTLTGRERDAIIEFLKSLSGSDM